MYIIITIYDHSNFIIAPITTRKQAIFYGYICRYFRRFREIPTKLVVGLDSSEIRRKFRRNSERHRRLIFRRKSGNTFRRENVHRKFIGNMSDHIYHRKSISDDTHFLEISDKTLSSEISDET